MSANEAIEKNIQIAVAHLRENNIENDFGTVALGYFEQYIDSRRDALTEQEKDSIYAIVGSYLGDCLCRAYAGEWEEKPEHGWGRQHTRW